MKVRSKHSGQKPPELQAIEWNTAEFQADALQQVKLPAVTEVISASIEAGAAQAAHEVHPAADQAESSQADGAGSVPAEAAVDDARRRTTAGPARSSRTAKPLRVLSTSLGMVLAANLLLVPAAFSESKPEPKLIEWSNEDVKTYFDPNMDWNIPLPDQAGQASPTPTPTNGGSAGTGSSAPIVYNNGLDWTDLMLYHLIFNSGGSYSSRGWSSSRPAYDYKTKKPYSVPTYDSTKFQNKQTSNSTVKPKTSNTTGAFNSKSTINSRNNSSSNSSGSTKSGSTSTKSGSVSGSSGSSSSSKSSSSSSGSIGGKSSGFSSSGSSSSGS
ncbi:hypothetical protein [Paenibacillus lutrae]|uniref:hypothetical protein n=1 Tax=Paenibacillus lutrae TaxID=2078573 RepID=UPI001F45D1EE|nr:hypothetical protein [Paenibacillus lutrae]